jgi:iron complex outermembrane receptor protein
MKLNVLASATAVAISLLCGSAVTQAQNPQTTENVSDEALLEEVIVTATRREVALQDVPLSVTAFSQDELIEKGIVNYQGLAYNTPGVLLNRASQNFNNFSVRGIATNGYNANLQSTVAIYIDELPISSNGNSTILDPNMFDVERVEFLRGPQGTLFGSNSLAGAVRFINKNPDLSEWDSTVLVDWGMTDGDSFRQRYNGMINIPLMGDTLAIRLVGFYRDEEGYLYNAGLDIKDSNSLKDIGGRAILLWQPTEKFYLRAMYMTEDNKPNDSSLINPDLGDKTRYTDKLDQFKAYIDNYNLTMGYDFGGAELTSSTTWSDYKGDFIVDLAGTFAQAIPFALDAVAWDENFVEEVRLVSDTGGKFDWVVGGYYNYKRRDVDYDYRSNVPFLDARGITGLPNPPYYQQFQSYFVTHEKAGFGELTYNHSEKFWVTGGLRYTSSDVQGFTKEGGYNSVFYSPYPGVAPTNYFGVALAPAYYYPQAVIVPVAAAVGRKGEESGFSYKFSVSYKPSENLTSYATVSTGFRTPVVNARAGSVSQYDPNDIIIPDGADSDDLTNYEIGLKGEFLDSRLMANIAAYFIDWSNIQVQANRVSDTIQFATNIGGAESKGIEVELVSFPVPDLMLTFNGSWNNAEVTKLSAEEAAISGAELGSHLAFPEWQGSMYLKWDFDVGADNHGFFTTNVMYVGSYPNMFPNVPGQPGVPAAQYGKTEAYTIVNMSLGSSLGEKWKLTGYVENLFDDDSLIYIHPEAFIDGRYGIPVPRTYGVRLEYQY